MVLLRRTGGHYFRQSEVEDLGVAARGDEDVCGLDVAVNDAVGMGGVERVGDFDSQRKQVSVSSGRPPMACLSVTPSRNSMAMKAWPFMLADLIDGADVGMVQRGRRLGFALETGESLRILATSSGRNLRATKR